MKIAKRIFIAVIMACSLMIGGCTKSEDKLYKGNLEIMDESGEVVITTDNLQTVSTSGDAENGYNINITFDEAGTEKIAKVTKSDVGKLLSLYVNGNLISSLELYEAITDGQVVITGFETSLDAYSIVNAIKNGSDQSDGETIAKQESTTEAVALVEDTSENINLPNDFVEISLSMYKQLPDTGGLNQKINDALQEIGVQNIVSAIYGNYDSNTSSVIVDAFIITDIDKRLIVSITYYKKNTEWNVYKIIDSDTGKCYYVEEKFKGNYVLYNYTTGKSINPQEETESEIVMEVPHRDGMHGISDKDVHDIGTPSTFERDDVRNDATGKWKISIISEEVQMIDYALSYYKKYFHSDDEVHGIVNFNYNTTTCITCMGDQLYVTVYDYVQGEEYDASLLFSGMMLADYIVYIDNGDIEQIQ